MARTLCLRRSVVTALLAVVACAVPKAPGALHAAAAARAPRQSIAWDVFDLTNIERGRARLVPFRTSELLTRAAQLHSEQMVALGRMSHILPGARYPAPPDRLAFVKYEWQAFGENVAMGQANATEALAAWMNSPGHRANILDPAYTELGVGYALDAEGQPYYTQVFARPAPAGP